MLYDELSGEISVARFVKVNECSIIVRRPSACPGTKDSCDRGRSISGNLLRVLLRLACFLADWQLDEDGRSSLRFLPP